MGLLVHILKMKYKEKSNTLEVRRITEREANKLSERRGKGI